MSVLPEHWQWVLSEGMVLTVSRLNATVYPFLCRSNVIAPMNGPVLREKPPLPCDALVRFSTATCAQALERALGRTCGKGMLSELVSVPGDSAVLSRCSYLHLYWNILATNIAMS